MRTALTTLAAALLAAAPLTAVSATADAPTTTAPAAPTTPAAPNQGYSVPVGTITDLGVLPMLGGLGNDFAHLLGQ
ncbi:hypothetical protein [Kitasatospora griseola]|uniref:hypothetical protein n=1 Tax=Kitasatospora griseola TaxID=2064 RepID=UPI003815D793